MNVALIILHADPARGGAERYTIDLANALKNRGHIPFLLASSFAPGVTGAHIPANGFTRTARYRDFLDNLDQHLSSTRYDIRHAMLPVRTCDLYHPHAGIAAEAAQRHNAFFNPRRRAMADVERGLLTGPNPPVVLCLSNYIKSFVRKHYPLPHERLATLFNAVELDHFQPRPRPPRERINALFIGHDFARKGLPAALSAIARVNDPRLHLTIVGEQSQRVSMPHWAHFVGQTDDPRPYYADADFFILPTKHDPCSLVVLEALAMGVPVITTKFNGASEIMTDAVHGFVLSDPENIEALADAVRKITDQPTREAMRQACLELRPQLSYEHHLDQLVSIYQTVRALK